MFHRAKVFDFIRGFCSEMVGPKALDSLELKFLAIIHMPSHLQDKGFQHG